MKIETSAKNEGSKQARVKFKTNEIDSVKTFTRDDSDYEEEESESDSEMEVDASEPMQDAESTSNAGWADVMQKILKANKPKGKKTVVLAKAKKLCDVKVKEEEEDVPFDIVGTKEEKTEPKEAGVKAVDQTVPTAKPRIREKSLGIRVKPSITDRECERVLQKIATKGVVQLFNAVKQQQMDIKKKMVRAGPLERKRELVLKNVDKNAFLDILMGGSKSIPVDNPVKPDKTVGENMVESNKNKNDKTWSVLRDDFVMGAKLKDWDKRDAEEEDSSAPEEMDSD